MKTNVKLLIAIALLATACSTGSKVTSSSYSDDLYYTPGDAVPVASKPVKEVAKPQQKSTVAMQVEETDQGKVVNNYVVPKSSRKDNNAYYFDEQPAYSDTIVEYADDKEQVTVNNYYEGEEMSYATRIRTFYDPYFYDPYWDPYWSFGFGFSFGWSYPYYGYGWGYPYYGYGWGYPYYGYGWGYPYYGYGYGYGWGYPYYGGGYYPYYGYGYPVYYGDVSYGKQNHSGRQGNSNAVRYGANNKSGNLGGASYGRQVNGSNVVSGSTRLSRGTSVNGTSGSTRSSATGASGTTGSATRLSRNPDNKSLSTAQQSQGAAGSQRIQSGRGETITNLRRSNSVQGTTGTTSTARPAGTSTRNSSGSYTPTYTRPRMNTQPTYNNGASRQTQQYSTGNTQSGRYSRPSGSGAGSTSGTSARTQSPSTYQRGSAASSSGRSSYNGGSSSGSYSSGSTRSSQSRSYDSGSGSSGRSYSPSQSFSSGGGGGGNSGGGGGGGNSGGGGGGGSRSGGGSGRTR